MGLPQQPLGDLQGGGEVGATGTKRLGLDLADALARVTENVS